MSKIKSKTEAYFALWENDKWVPYASGTIADCIWPENIIKNDLPQPRFLIGQKIKFKWDKGYREGIFVKCYLSWKRSFFSYERKLEFTVGYTIKCIGHSHCFYDKIYEEGATDGCYNALENKVYDAQIIKE